MKRSKLEEKVHACFRELFENSEPKGVWDVLKHRRDDFFMEYYIDKETFDKILHKHSKWLRKYDKKTFLFSVNLGPSPSTVRHHEK